MKNVVYFASCYSYFLKYGLSLVDSCYYHKNDVCCVVFVQNKEEEIAIQKVVSKRPFLKIDIKYKIFEHNLWIVFERYLMLVDILPRYDSVLLLDADALVRSSLDWNVFGNRSVGLRFHCRTEMGEIVFSEGCMYIQNDCAGNKFIQTLKENFKKINECFSYKKIPEKKNVLRKKGNDWQWLKSSLVQALNFDVGSIPHLYGDVFCCEDGVIWTPLGKKKFEKGFVLEQKKYLNPEDHHFLEDIKIENWRK